MVLTKERTHKLLEENREFRNRSTLIQKFKNRLGEYLCEFRKICNFSSKYTIEKMIWTPYRLEENINQAMLKMISVQIY